MDPLAELAKLQSQTSAKTPDLLKKQTERHPPQAPKKSPAPRKSNTMLFVGLGTVVVLVAGVLAWYFLGRGSGGEPSVVSQIMSKVAPSPPPFKIEGARGVEDQHLEFSIWGIAERPFSIYRVSFNGEHDATVTWLVEDPKNEETRGREEHSLPLKLSIGKDAYIEQNPSHIGDTDDGIKKWEKQQEYNKRVIFVDFETDVGNYRYTVDSGEIKAK